MAEESRVKRNTFEDIVFTLFALMLVAQIFQRLPTLLEEKVGITLGEKTESGLLVAGAGVSIETPIGTRVSSPASSKYFSNPSDDGEASGSFGLGASLVLLNGPVEDVDGRRWWFVEETETGKKGWVLESELVKEGVGGIGALTKLGTKARSLLDISVWEKPGGPTTLGLMKMGEWGVLTDGPISRNGSRWWFFDRDDSNDDGWVPESALTLYSEKGWGIGDVVVANRTSDMFERAGGGEVLGFLNEGEKGKVIGGPVLVGGVYWWLIENDDGERGWVPESALEDGSARGWLKGLFATILLVGAVITVVLLAAIIYVTVRTNQVRVREAKRINAEVPEEMVQKRNERWDKAREHASSDNPNDWRLAIIEADVMLDEVITRMGYHGVSLGDKLKQIARGDLNSLDAAWEAHKVRNQIAHEGSDFILTQREAQRVVDLYREVFEELKYV